MERLWTKSIYSYERWNAFPIHRVLYAVSNTAAVYQADGRQRIASWSGNGRVYAVCSYSSPNYRRPAGPFWQTSVYRLGAAIIHRSDVYV